MSNKISKFEKNEREVKDLFMLGLF